MPKLSIKDFLTRAHAKHGSCYDYIKVEYKSARTKVCIICQTHGEFFQTPDKHLSGAGCCKCAAKARGDKRRFTLEEYVRRAHAVHDQKYDYSKVIYKNNIEKICLICPTHGEFFQNPQNHLTGQGCPKCGILKYAHKRRLTEVKFLKRATATHGNKYDYSKVVYNYSHIKVRIICPLHGEFLQTPVSHLKGLGCMQCGYLSAVALNKGTSEEFIQKANKAHGKGTYDYSKIVYKNAKTKVCIICPVHGEFFQYPEHHLRGQGCPCCSGSKGEKAITRWLNRNEIPFEYHYINQKLKGDGQRSLHFDFCTKGLKFFIEYDGQQHFKPVRFNSIPVEKAVEVFQKTQHYDFLKNQYCIDNNILLLRISYKEYKDIPDILFKKLQSGAPCHKLFINEMTPEQLSSYYEENK